MLGLHVDYFFLQAMTRPAEGGFGTRSAARRRRVEQRPLGLRLAAVGCLVLAVPLPFPNLAALLSETGMVALIVVIILTALVVVAYLLSAWQLWHGAGVALRFGYVGAALLVGASLLVAVSSAADGRELLAEPAPISALQLGMMALIITSLLTPGARRFVWSRRPRAAEPGGAGTIGVYEREGVGVPVSSPEDDYLFLFDGWQSLRMSDLLAGAGAEVLSEFVLNALQNPTSSPPEEWRAALSEYRATGRQFPPLYAVRLRVEVERVTEENLGDRWKAARASSPLA
jgi:hypothetical protein